MAVKKTVRQPEQPDVYVCVWTGLALLEHSSAVQSALSTPQGISCQNSLFKFTEETHKGLCYIFFAGEHMKSSTIPPLKIVFPALWVEEEGLFFFFLISTWM